MLYPCHGGSESQNQFPKIPSSNDLPQLQIMVMITGVSSPSVCLYGAVSYRETRGACQCAKSVEVKVHGHSLFRVQTKNFAILFWMHFLRHLSHWNGRVYSSKKSPLGTDHFIKFCQIALSVSIIVIFMLLWVVLVYWAHISLFMTCTWNFHLIRWPWKFRN